MQAFWPQMGRKLGLCPLLGRGAGSPSSTMCVWRPRLTSVRSGEVPSWSIQPFTHNRHGPKIGGSAPFLGGRSWVSWSSSNTKSPEPDRGLYLHTKWHFNPSSHLVTTDMGRKLGAVPLWGGGPAGSASNTMWPCSAEVYFLLNLHAKFHLDPSNRRLATQYTNATDRTGQTAWDRTGQATVPVRYHRANRFTNGRPKTETDRLPTLVSRKPKNTEKPKKKIPKNRKFGFCWWRY